MPMGPAPLGLVYFTGVKLVGYAAAGAYFRKRIGAERPRAITFGIARTLLGLAVGVGFATSLLALDIANSELLFYIALVPVRIAEWLLALWFFFGRSIPLPPGALLRYSLLGSIWSYLLDVPAIASMFVLPGGSWIC